MAAFCTKCGAALGTGPFCTACGTPVAAAAAAPTTPAAATPVTPTPAPGAPQGGSNLIKIVLIIGGIIALLMVLGMGSCFYIAYRAKKEFSEAPGSSRVYTGKKDACSLITASEVSDAIGETAQVVTESSNSALCRFKYGASGDNMLDVTVTWRGGAMAMKIMHAAIGHNDKQQGLETVEGIGDEAYLVGVGSVLLMRKGDVMVNINMSAAQNKGEAVKKIASTIADRL